MLYNYFLPFLKGTAVKIPGIKAKGTIIWNDSFFRGGGVGGFFSERVVIGGKFAFKNNFTPASLSMDIGGHFAAE